MHRSCKWTRLLVLHCVLFASAREHVTGKSRLEVEEVWMAQASWSDCCAYQRDAIFLTTGRNSEYRAEQGILILELWFGRVGEAGLIHVKVRGPRDFYGIIPRYIKQSF